MTNPFRPGRDQRTRKRIFIPFHLQTYKALHGHFPITDKQGERRRKKANMPIVNVPI
jgi:hypothetical protein